MLLQSFFFQVVVLLLEKESHLRKFSFAEGVGRCILMAVWYFGFDWDFSRQLR